MSLLVEWLLKPLASSVVVFVSGFVLSLYFNKRIRHLVQSIMHRLYGVEVDAVYDNRHDAENDLLKDLDATSTLSIWTSRGLDLHASEKFQRILQKASSNQGKSLKVRVLLPNPFPPLAEYDWTMHRNNECSLFDPGMGPGVLAQQIISTLAYLNKPFTENTIELRLTNCLHIGRIVITDSNAYFAPYTNKWHGSNSRVMKCPSSGAMYGFLTRAFESYWESAVRPDSPRLTSQIALATVENVGGVIFDLDGTLVDSMATHAFAMKQAFLRHGCVISEDEFLSYGGKPTQEIVLAIARKHDFKLPADVLDCIAKEKDQEFLSRISEVKGISCAMDFADRLRGRVKIAIASGSTREVVNAVLEHLKMQDWFDVIVTAEDHGLPKPSPECFIEAASRMAIPTSRCLVVEDSQAGFEASMAAGIRCVDINVLRSLVFDDLRMRLIRSTELVGNHPFGSFQAEILS